MVDREVAQRMCGSAQRESRDHESREGRDAKKPGHRGHGPPLESVSACARRSFNLRTLMTLTALTRGAGLRMSRLRDLQGTRRSYAHQPKYGNDSQIRERRAARSLLASCSPAARATAGAAAPINVLTSITTFVSLAQAVGGDRVRVTSLVPVGASPEDYQPAPSDIERSARRRRSL